MVLRGESFKPSPPKLLSSDVLVLAKQPRHSLLLRALRRANLRFANAPIRPLEGERFSFAFIREFRLKRGYESAFRRYSASSASRGLNVSGSTSASARSIAEGSRRTKRSA